MRGRTLVVGHLAVFAALLSADLVPALAQDKPPAQVINLADVRKQAQACDEYATVLDQATAALRSGAMTAATGEAVRRHKAVVDAICGPQDAPSAGRNLATVLERTADIRSMLP